MGLIISKDLPYIEDLKKDNIEIIFKEELKKEVTLKVAILNLMPNKEATELHLLSALGHSPSYIEVDFLYTSSYAPTHISNEYLQKFYKILSKEMLSAYDGLIITGAPVEKLEFTEVIYWEELKDIMNFAYNNLTSTIYICWAAQAALNHFYEIDKKLCTKKFFGVFSHSIRFTNPLTEGINQILYAPHSRYSYIDTNDIFRNENLSILADSKEVGPYLIASKDYKNIMALGHIEYDKHTLRKEYLRDRAKGMEIQIPENYFIADNPKLEIIDLWSNHKKLLFSNWINILK